MAQPDDPSTDLGFLVHVFHRQQRTETMVYGVGRLACGETFAFADSRTEPGFYVRASDVGVVRAGLARARAKLQDTDLTTMDGEPVCRVSARRTAPLRLLAEEMQRTGCRTYEADLTLSRRYLIERGLCGSVSIRGEWRPGTGVNRVYRQPELAPAVWEPRLTVLALDIETDPEASRVLAVSLVGCASLTDELVEEVHVVGITTAEDPPQAVCHPSERDLLQHLAARVRAIDPDVLTGWNVVDFDLPVLQRRYQAQGLPFNLGRSNDDSWYQEGEVWGGSRVVVYGRQVLDAMHLVRAGGSRFGDFRLDTVARALLGRGKTLEAGDEEDQAQVIERAYTHDRAAFCAYCLEDSRLVRDILARENTVQLVVRRCMLTGLPLERAWGSVAALDFLYIGALRQRRMVAPTAGVDRDGLGRSPGGLVMAPKAGLFRHVFVFDFRSLYPSIIRTFNIDPLAHIQARRQSSMETASPATRLLVAPNGAAFVRETGILPQILERFFARRQEAREAGDQAASYAYKITMNSFYGVLATDSCRFADDELAGAITGFGHYILRWATTLLEEQERGTVLYGDTDSLFVDLGLTEEIEVGPALARGQELCDWINAELARHVQERYEVTSHLLLEFEKYYRRFLLPPMRGGGERGRAKGYAGLRVDARGEALEIVGMEAVRHDWTELAHRLQYDLFGLLFHDAPAGQLQERAAEWVDGVRAGKRDAELVYRKSLRRPLSRYGVGSPPHVVAARMLPKPGGMIAYVMTVDGPQPVGRVTAPLDYEHYIEKQITPIVRTISQVKPLDLNAAVGGPADLFATGSR